MIISIIPESDEQLREQVRAQYARTARRMLDTAAAGATLVALASNQRNSADGQLVSAFVRARKPAHA
ncbi:MAG: hypothetical protein ACLQUY_15240 [Ktedonobacterales bacterium]